MENKRDIIIERLRVKLMRPEHFINFNKDRYIILARKLEKGIFLPLDIVIGSIVRLISK